jgi:hypothetical protein
MDFAGAVKRGKFVVQQPRPQHAAEGGEVGLADGLGSPGAKLVDGLQHGESLSFKAKASNDSFRC